MNSAYILNEYLKKPITETSKVSFKVGDSAGNSSNFFLIYAGNDAISKYVWHNRAGTAFDPRLGNPEWNRIILYGDSYAKRLYNKFWNYFASGSSLLTGDSKRYHVYYSNSGDTNYDPKTGRREIVTVTLVGDTNYSLGGKFWKLYKNDGAGDTVVIWYKIGDSGTAPSTGNYKLQIGTIPVNATAEMITDATKARLESALSSMFSVVKTATNKLKITVLNYGNATAATNGNMGGDFALSFIQGINAIAALANSTGIKVTLTKGDTVASIGDSAKLVVYKTKTAMNTAASSYLTAAGDSTVLIVTNTYAWNVTNPSDSTMSSYFAVTNVGGTIPNITLTTKTGLPVTIVASDSKTGCAIRYAAAINADSTYFSAARQGDTVVITNKQGGPATDITGNSQKGWVFLTVGKGDSDWRKMEGDSIARAYFYRPASTKCAYLRTFNLVIGDTDLTYSTRFANRGALISAINLQIMTSGDTVKKLLLGPIYTNADLGTSFCTTNLFRDSNTALTMTPATAHYHYDFVRAFGDGIEVDGRRGEYLRFIVGDSTIPINTMEAKVEGQIRD